MKIITYKIGSKQHTVKLRDEDAETIRVAMANNLGSVTIAGTTIRTRDIQGIENLVEGEGGEMNAQKVKIVRRALIEAADTCRICPRETMNGVERGRGWVETANGDMRECQCQLAVKARFGIDPADRNWSGRDD